MGSFTTIVVVGAHAVPVDSGNVTAGAGISSDSGVSEKQFNRFNTGTVFDLSLP